MRTGTQSGAPLSLALLFLLACAKGREVAGDVAFGLSPFASETVVVERVERFGPYLAAAIQGEHTTLTVLAPPEAPCGELLRLEAVIRYELAGLFGRLAVGGRSCDLVGIASLAEWRDRRPRGPSSPRPRATARFEVTFQDSELLWLRGRFPLVGRIGIPAGYDVVALVPSSAACQAVAERGEATLEFHHSGSTPYRLLEGPGFCPILGFASPRGMSPAS